MYKILFVCYGNICRSPMAEYLMKNTLKSESIADKFYIESAATSDEELNNPVYPPIKAILDGLKIDCSGKRARRLIKADYEKFDYILCMDKNNVRDTERFFGGDKDGKIYMLNDFTANKVDIADPWWTRDFNKAYNEIDNGVNCFIEYIKNKK